MLEGPYRLSAPGDHFFTLEQVAVPRDHDHDSIAAMVLSDEIEWCVVAGEARVPSGAVSAYNAREVRIGATRRPLFWHVSADGQLSCSTGGDSFVVHVCLPQSEPFDIRAPRAGGPRVAEEGTDEGERA